MGLRDASASKNADVLKNTLKWNEQKYRGNTKEYKNTLNLQLCEGGVEDEELLLVESHPAAHLA